MTLDEALAFWPKMGPSWRDGYRAGWLDKIIGKDLWSARMASNAAYARGYDFGHRHEIPRRK
jgi:hypothetical protein